jgi:hypothetical protein
MGLTMAACCELDRWLSLSEALHMMWMKWLLVCKEDAQFKKLGIHQENAYNGIILETVRRT